MFLFGAAFGGLIASGLGNLLELVGVLRPENRAAIGAVLELARQPPERAKDLAEGLKATFPHECSPYFLGIWDTLTLTAWLCPIIHPAYSTGIPNLPIGRHALAIDEPRAFFHQNLWSPPTQSQDLKQVWFVGSHADVAGGYPEQESGLSGIALEWMVREAMLAGLVINEERAARAFGATGEFSAPDVIAPQHRPSGGLWWLFEYLPFRILDSSTNPPTRKWRISLGRGRP